MAPLHILALAVALFASYVAGMGPHYLSDHEEGAVFRRAAHVGNVHARHEHAHKRHRSAVQKRKHATRQKKRAASCKRKASTSSSSGSVSGTIGGSSASTKNQTSMSSGGQSNSLAQLISETGITQFLQKNGPGIGSWFNPDSSSDSTNGHSWCGYPYNINTNGFAPDVSKMLANYGGDYTKAATAYCGLEAIVTAPDGTSQTMYIVDGFDPAWVREPGSIDIIQGHFAALFGKSTDNKDDVIQDITWELTGDRSMQYSFKGPGN